MEEGLIGLLPLGAEPFRQLSEKMFSSAGKIERGTRFSSYQDQMLQFLLSNNFLGRDSATICSNDIVLIENHLLAWFSTRAKTRTLFVPCLLSEAASPRFSVGPVSFIFIDDVSKTEFFPKLDSPIGRSAHNLDRLLNEMREERAHWLAAVEINDCDQQRATEIGELAVDLAIVALQLGIPRHFGTHNMARLAVRRGSTLKTTWSLVDDHLLMGFSNKQPGISIGEGLLGELVSKLEPVIGAVGRLVRSYTTGSYRLPRIERAWCDAAYWLHQGLAEPMDSIAVAKLETAIEVLFSVGNTRESERRMLEALETFYSLKPNDPITKFTATTAQQFAKGLVRDRSRILHGTWSTLNARLGASREQLENFALTLVRAFSMELETYAQSTAPLDDLRAFLSWVKLRRRQKSDAADAS